MCKVPWLEAMSSALYGPAGFYRQAAGPAAHFRTSIHASPLFASAITTLLTWVDTALDHPDRLDFVDVGAGRGELAQHVLALAPASIIDRLHITAVEIADRPRNLPEKIAWRHEIPVLDGLLVANEWLDNVPLNIVELDDERVPRIVLCNQTDGSEELGAPITGDDLTWQRRWWPLHQPGDRAELGHTRDNAWHAAVAKLSRGVAIAIDYGHLTEDRPVAGTLAGYRDGGLVRPIADGSCDLTAHVAMDAVAEAGAKTDTSHTALITQAAALGRLGLRASRPDPEMARVNPQHYLAMLNNDSHIAELAGRGGLGGFWWLLHAKGISPQKLPAALARLLADSER